MKTIKVGIIGQGRSGRDIHGQYLLKASRRFKIVAVSDPMKERRKRAVQEYGCEACASHRSLLGRDDIDLIVNTSPTRLHVPITLECLKAGHHVLCEKPLARTVADVDKLIRGSKKARKVLAVFQQNRYAPYFRQIRKVIDSGVLGRIVLIKAAWNGFSRRWDWQALRKNHGGNLLNTGPHPLDQLLQLFGADVMPNVTCVMDRANTYGDAEDHVKVILQKRGHPTIDLEISSCCAYPSRLYNIYGTRGGLIVDSGTVQWKYYKSTELSKRQLTKTPIVDSNGMPAYCADDLKWHERKWQPPKSPKSLNASFYNMLYKTLTTGAPLEVTLKHIRQQVAVIEECHRQNPASKMPESDM